MIVTAIGHLPGRLIHGDRSGGPFLRLALRNRCLEIGKCSF
jgi:hypothetical protein